jgi:hypothetical protein
VVWGLDLATGGGAGALEVDLVPLPVDEERFPVEAAIGFAYDAVLASRKCSSGERSDSTGMMETDTQPSSDMRRELNVDEGGWGAGSASLSDTRRVRLSFREGVFLGLVSGRVEVEVGFWGLAWDDLPSVLWDSWCERSSVLALVGPGEVGDETVGGMGRGRTARVGGMGLGWAGLWTTEEMLSPMLDTGEGRACDAEALLAVLVWDVSEAWSELARWMTAGPGRGARAAMELVAAGGLSSRRAS